MAFDDDDVNKVKDSDDFGISELARIGEQFNRAPYAQRDLYRRRRQAQATVNRFGGVEGEAGRQPDIDELKELLPKLKGKENAGRRAETLS